MNRIKAYGMILIGVPAGYIASYFMQASTSRLFLSLSQYITSAPKILLPTVFGSMSQNAEVVKGMYTTAFVGIIIGVAVSGGIAYAMESKAKAAGGR